MTVPFEELLAGDPKACCASVYEAEPVRWLLGGQLHPGGEALTLRAAELAGIGAGDRVLDVASGAGTSAMLLARELGAEVVGVDLGETAVARANAAAEAAARGGDPAGATPRRYGRVRFVAGDAEALPFADDGFDAVLCECSLCTFPDKLAAASEIARVLRPGGTAAISDVMCDVAALPPPLRAPAARVACVADALTEDGYLELLRAAGLEPVATERHDAALAEMVDRVEARLRLARMVRAPQLEPFRADLAAAVDLARLAREAAADGRLGYGVIVARRS